MNLDCCSRHTSIPRKRRGKPTTTTAICQKTVSATKEYNLKRHYDTLHKHNFEKYEGKERKNILQSLKDKQEKQVSRMLNFVSSQKTSLAASYEVALLLAKKMKPFREGELVKAFAIKMAEAFGEEKIAEKFKTVSIPSDNGKKSSGFKSTRNL